MEPVSLALVFSAAGLVGVPVACGAALRWHYGRWVAYYEHKGLAPPGTGRDVLQEEAADSALLVADFVRGFFGDGLRRPPTVQGPVVFCVHGYTQNGTNFVRLRRALRAAGRPTMAMSMGRRLAPVSWYLGRLERALERAVALEPEPIDVVCHSMGGVLLRAVLVQRPDLADRVRMVITLGSPHRGTAAARGVPWLPEVQAMKRKSSFLESLPRLTELVPRVVTVAATLDTIVYPVDTALEEAAEQVVIRTGHAGLLTRPEAVDAICQRLISSAPERSTVAP